MEDNKIPVPGKREDATQCALPPPLEDWQLLASLDVEPVGAVVDHLDQCAYCRARRAALAKQDRTLRAKLRRATCPSALTLGEYHLGVLSPARAREVIAHIAECPHCATELAETRRHLRSIESDVQWSLGDKARVLIGRVVHSARGPFMTGATLAPALSGLRGRAAAPLLIEGDGVLLTLDLEPANGDRVQINGQLAAEDQDRWTYAVVELRQRDRTTAATIVDDLGSFRGYAQRELPLDIRITSASGPDFEASGISLTS